MYKRQPSLRTPFSAIRRDRDTITRASPCQARAANEKSHRVRRYRCQPHALGEKDPGPCKRERWGNKTWRGKSFDDPEAKATTAEPKDEQNLSLRAITFISTCISDWLLAWPLLWLVYVYARFDVELASQSESASVSHFNVLKPITMFAVWLF